MTSYFAYGSNMNRAVMGRHCPSAVALGQATLDRHRFIVNADGYATVVPQPGARVRGVLWRVTARDIAALNTYESVDTGLYRAETVAVRTAHGLAPARIYVARSERPGRPRPGYLETVLDAAAGWNLPPDYIAELAQWAGTGFRAARTPDCGEIA
jgi:gamma-glutamylcyclotransferase (GGCT)/AIG2-like uncharacterized protein YtfP